MASYPAIASFALACLLAACSNPTSYEPSRGKPDLPCDENAAKKIALELCRLSDGPFPNWPRVDEFEQWLTPDEARAVRRVDAAFKKHIPKKQIPKYNAVSRFIAQNTSCELTYSEKDTNSVAIGFEFIQKTPYVPFAPEINSSDDPVALENAWLAEYNKNWDGSFRTRHVNIILKLDSDNNWKILSNVAKNYANPLDKRDTERQFITELEHGLLERARWDLLMLCNEDETSCGDFTALYDQAEQQFAQSASFAREFLSIDEQKIIYIAQNSILPYTAATLNITNNSDFTLSNVMMRTDEKDPQFCVLQNTRQKRGDDPAVIAPHTSVKVYCALSAETRSSVKLEWVDFITSSDDHKPM